MQCYEFEALMRYMTYKVSEFVIARQYDQLDLADILIDHNITSVEQISDIVSLARNLQVGIRQAT